jgi:RNA polymerase sigma-70 factor, ECF subfamily
MKIDPAELAEHRPYLFKFAMLQLGQKDVAEDVVQEALLAAVKGIDGFSGRSSPRTWLTAILLHKIADHRRLAGRELSLDAQAQAHGDDSVEASSPSTGSAPQPPRSRSNRRMPGMRTRHPHSACRWSGAIATVSAGSASPEIRIARSGR